MIAATLMVKIAADTTAFNSALQKAQQSVRGSAAQMQQASGAVTALQTRITGLTQGFRIGSISEEAYAAGLKEVRADMHQLTAVSELSVKSQARLASVGATVTRQLNAVTTSAKRSATGFEAFGVAALAASELAAGGIASVGVAASTLGVFARGNPWLIGLMAGLTALAAAWQLIQTMANKATDAVDGFIHKHREAAAGRLAVVQELLRTAPATIQQRISTSTPMGPGPTIVSTIENPAIARLQAEEQRLLVEVNTLPVTLARNVKVLRDHVDGLTESVRGFVTAMRNAAELRAAALAALGSPRGMTGDQLNNLISPKTFGVDAKGGSGPAANSTIAFTLKSMDEIVSKAQAVKAQMLDVGSMIAQGVIAIAQGAASGFKGMGKILLSLIGNIMVQVGQSMIMFGIGMKALRMAIKNPVAAIAAGVLLVAAGSALSASAQRSINAGGEGGGGGSFSSAPNTGAGDTGNGLRQGTVIINGRPNDVVDLDTLAGLLRELGYRRIEWNPGA